MNVTYRRAVATAAMATLSIAVLGACSGGGGDNASAEVASLDDGGSGDASTGNTTAGEDDGGDAPEDREEALLAYTECMRDNGIDMPDPQFDGERGDVVIGGGERAGIDPDDPDFEAAQDECQPLLDDARGEIELDPEQEAEMREQLLKMAECMRDHGIDMPDPQFSDGGGFVVQQGGPGGDVRDDPDFQAALEECEPEDGFGPGAAGRNESESED